MKTGIKIIATNKKAPFNYFLSDNTECGIELKGTEIKSLRVNGATIGDSYIVIREGNAEIINMYIKPYDHGNLFNHDPLRSRRLLLHKKEIRWFEMKMKQGGFTVVPTKISYVSVSNEYISTSGSGSSRETGFVFVFSAHLAKRTVV